MAYASINQYLHRNGRDFTSFDGLPKIDTELLNMMLNKDIEEELSYDSDYLSSILRENLKKINLEQNHIFKTIIACVKIQKVNILYFFNLKIIFFSSKKERKMFFLSMDLVEQGKHSYMRLF